jgi:hypothetical protein
LPIMSNALEGLFIYKKLWYGIFRKQHKFQKIIYFGLEIPFYFEFFNQTAIVQNQVGILVCQIQSVCFFFKLCGLHRIYEL